MAEEADLATVQNHLAMLEQATAELKKRITATQEIMRNQTEAIDILLPLMSEIGMDKGVPQEIKRRIDFAMKQVAGIADRVLAL